MIESTPYQRITVQAMPTISRKGWHDMTDREMNKLPAKSTPSHRMLSSKLNRVVIVGGGVSTPQAAETGCLTLEIFGRGSDGCLVADDGGVGGTGDGQVGLPPALGVVLPPCLAQAKPGKLSPHFVRGLRATLWILFEAGKDDVFEHNGDLPFGPPGRRDGRRLHVSESHGHSAFCFEHRFACKQPVADATEGVEIRARVHRFA